MRSKPRASGKKALHAQCLAGRLAVEDNHPPYIEGERSIGGSSPQYAMAPGVADHIWGHEDG